VAATACAIVHVVSVAERGGRAFTGAVAEAGRESEKRPDVHETPLMLNAVRKFGVPGKSAGIWLRRRALRAARLTAQPETASDAPSPAWGDEVGPRACCDRPREMRFPAPSSGLAKQPDFWPEFDQ
jgi:hypothetical protein